VFADYHHADLWYSLHLLFEERMGGTLLRPIGLEWFQKGFWKIAEPYHNAPDTIDQFLGVPHVGWERDPVQQYGDAQLIDGVYHIPIKVASGMYVQKAITFDQFQKLDFDIIIASYPGHDCPYAELARLYHPKAVFIRHIGDTSELPRCARNVLLVVKTPMPPGINSINYWPEHHTDYSYTPPPNHNVVKSFLTHFKTMPDFREFTVYERALPDFTFKMHGSNERDGLINGCNMPEAIKDAAFVWHVKYTGCGGFLPRQALSCGRPLLVKKHYCLEYSTMEGDLYEDGVNCIDLDLQSWQGNIDRLKYYSDPDRHTEMCKNTAEKFNRDVDFGREAEKVRAWLEGLQGN
jgi:hypothetical protein